MQPVGCHRIFMLFLRIWVKVKHLRSRLASCGGEHQGRYSLQVADNYRSRTTPQALPHRTCAAQLVKQPPKTLIVT